MKYYISREFLENQRKRGALTEREYRNYVWKVRRQREIRNHILMLIFTICLILGMAVSYHSIVSYAESDMENVSFKYYTRVDVKYGDSLWSIARQYGDKMHYSSMLDYVQEVVSINQLKDNDMIREGQSLIIPYYSDEYKE